MAVRKTITIPEPVQKRLTKYNKEHPETWDALNISAICAEAISKALEEKGIKYKLNEGVFI